ncbi:hypothetical protein FE257_003098 [Aspergillus nanangensis]|uniref:Uncharacterized protein n=1 Tax=Aspergillus nanangensis TaxID=2582783 RepID=A0AAD4GN10_ASPNN|nr:hypothetical protein FE257_003098 [Aspergillus nanangensis]
MPECTPTRGGTTEIKAEVPATTAPKSTSVSRNSIGSVQNLAQQYHISSVEKAFTGPEFWSDMNLSNIDDHAKHCGRCREWSSIFCRSLFPSPVFFLFNDELTQAQLVGSTWETCVHNLRSNPIMFEGT